MSFCLATWMSIGLENLGQEQAVGCACIGSNSNLNSALLYLKSLVFAVWCPQTGTDPPGGTPVPLLRCPTLHLLHCAELAISELELLQQEDAAAGEGVNSAH